jgi:hypothetical protein
MAVSGARFTVSTSAVAVAGSAGGSASLQVVIRNNDATNGASLGDSSVGAATGFLLAAGQTVAVDLEPGERIYAIRAAAADVIVSVLTTGA